jgi:hypothetical protein
MTARTTKEALAVRVVARRLGTGTRPFGWEIHGADTIVPLYVSPDRFKSLQAAFEAGQLRLGEFITQPVRRPGQRDSAYDTMTRAAAMQTLD